MTATPPPSGPHHALAVGRHGGGQVGEVELGVGGDGEDRGGPGEAVCEVGGDDVEAEGEALLAQEGVGGVADQQQEGGLPGQGDEGSWQTDHRPLHPTEGQQLGAEGSHGSVVLAVSDTRELWDDLVRMDGEEMKK